MWRPKTHLIDRINLDVDLPKYLSAYSMNGPADFSGYRLRFYAADRKLNTRIGIPSWNQYGFVLKFNRRGIACINFDQDEEHEHALLVEQIQGRKGSQRPLAPFVWSRMLIRIVADSAQEGFREVWVRRAEDNSWWGEHGSIKVPMELHWKRLRKRYDTAAEEEGFRLKEVRYSDGQTILYWALDL